MPDGKPVHAGFFQDVQVRVGQVVGVGLNGDLPDGVEAFRMIERCGKLVHHDRRRAAAHVDPLEAVAPFLIEGKLLAQGPEVLPAQGLVEGHAVEGAVGAELFTERDVEVKQAGAAGAGCRERGVFPLPEVHGPGELFSRHVPDNFVDHGDLTGCAWPAFALRSGDVSRHHPIYQQERLRA